MLDLGCGPGMASARMRESGLRADPIDASIEMVNLANNIYDLNARKVEFSKIHGEEIYDGVWANFSLLHATKIEFKLHLHAIYKVLKPMGYFAIGMKLGEGERRDEIGRFYAYYSEIDLNQLLTNAGFNLCETYYGEEIGLVGVVEPWIMLRLRK